MYAAFNCILLEQTGSYALNPSGSSEPFLVKPPGSTGVPPASVLRDGETRGSSRGERAGRPRSQGVLGFNSKPLEVAAGN